MLVFIIFIIAIMGVIIGLRLLFSSKMERKESLKDAMKIMFTIKILVIRGFLALGHIFTRQYALKGVDTIDKSDDRSDHPSTR